MTTPRGLFQVVAVVIAGVIASAGCYQSHGVFDGGVLRDGPGLDALDAPRRDAPRRDAPVLPDAPRRRDAFEGDVPPRDVSARDVPSTGGPCARDGDCDGAFCVLDTSVAALDLAPVPLRCGGAGFTAPGLECESNLECENGLCALAGGCVEPCVTGSDCRVGERCIDVPIVTAESAVQMARACARWVDVPGAVEVTTNEDVAVSPLRSERFTSPRTTRAHRLILNIAAQSDPDRTIDRVALADGRVLFDLTAVEPPINPSVSFFDLAPILIPNAPWPASLEVRSGLTYDITTGTDDHVFHRVVMGYEGNGHTLDLNVYFVGVQPTASNRRALSAMLSAYEDILATYGVGLGRVRELQVVGASGSNLAFIESEDEVAELVRFSAGAARPALNVFLISSSPMFLGISAGIPGAMGMHGTGASGVLLSFDDLASLAEEPIGLELMALVIAHELGHFSGLFHTTEGDGSSQEPLPDTPICDLSHDTDGDGVVIGDECVGAGANNIMFWAALPPSTFSPDQRDVLRAAPVLLP